MHRTWEVSHVTRVKNPWDRAEWQGITGIGRKETSRRGWFPQEDK